MGTTGRDIELQAIIDNLRTEVATLQYEIQQLKVELAKYRESE